MPKEKPTGKRQEKPKRKNQPQKPSRELSREQLEDLRRKLQKKYR